MNEMQNQQMQNQQMPNPSDMNPFDAQKYKDINMPDEPISGGNSMVDSLLNNNEVPKTIRKKFWHIFHKDNVLTFLDEKRQEKKMLSFDITKIDLLNSTSYYDYNFEMETELNIMRNMFETKLDRARGVENSNIKNERTVLQSQFSESRHVNSDEMGGQIKEGFFKRLLGRR